MGAAVRTLAVATMLLNLGLAAGCHYAVNHYRESGPSTEMSWDSPTAQEIRARMEPAQLAHRDWPQTNVALVSGAVGHYPLYFEDPFVDKGHGRSDASDPHNIYHLGWEDWIAFPYSYARYTANWLLLPVSAIVTPPWMPMESDGELSRQALGYDHDARPMVPWPGFEPLPAATEMEPAPTEPAPPESEGDNPNTPSDSYT